MNQQLTSKDILAQMMADAQGCNLRAAERFDAPKRQAAKPRKKLSPKTDALVERIMIMASGRWVSLSELSYRLGLSKGYVSAITWDMHNAGLLSRDTAPVRAARGGSRVVLWRAV